MHKPTIRRIGTGIIACLLGVTGIQAQRSLSEFQTPPIEYRPIPLWFWNNATVEREKALEQFRQMIHKDGYGGCAILPFGGEFTPEYLSEEYMNLYGAIIEEARKEGAQMSVYDEYGFPSGSMGAINGDGTPRFMDKYPDATVHRLDKKEYDVKSGTQFVSRLPEGKLMAVVGMEQETKKIISLRKFINRNDILSWNVPSGKWKVLCFICVKDGDPNVDYLNPEAVSLFTQEVHQRYADRFSSAFGSVITETFFDEPTMYRAQGRMWTPDFNERFKKEYGFSPELLYPSLWQDIGEETASARNYLFGFRSKLYSEGFMKGIAEWAEKHRIEATGHQDQEEIANPVSVSGDLMLSMKYQQIPGIDKIGGGRPTELFYKVVSSAAYNWDKTQVMSETYGAMGNIPVDQLYSIAMDQYTKGINRLIPHAVWYNDQNVTFLPELSYRNPLYNQALPDFNRFLARLNYLLRPDGGHVADIAMLYPIQSLQAEHYLDGAKGFYEGGVDIPHTDYPQVSAILTDSLCRDFTYLHPEVMDERCIVKNGKLLLQNNINREQYDIVIVPGMKTIAWSHVQKLKKFRAQGGTVIFTSQLPVRAVEPGKTEQVGKGIRQLFDWNGKKEGKTVFIQQPTSTALLAALDESERLPDITFSADNELRYIHKRIEGTDLYYFANLRPNDCTTEIRLRGKIMPLALDPHAGSYFKPTYRYEQTPSGTPVTVITIAVKGKHSFFISDRKLFSL